MREELLSILEKNSKIDLKELSAMLGVSEIDVANEICALEKDGVIGGYHTLINWEKTSIEKVTALIEVKVTPQRGQGFDKIAERIYNYPEVNAVYLISGGFDLLVTLEERTLKEIANFVSDKLSTLSHKKLFHLSLFQISIRLITPIIITSSSKFAYSLK